MHELSIIGLFQFVTPVLCGHTYHGRFASPLSTACSQLSILLPTYLVKYPSTGQLMLPSEILYEITAKVVTEYIDETITEPYPPPKDQNDVLALLQVSHQIREVTMKVICDAFQFKRNLDGSLPSNPFRLLDEIRVAYRRALHLRVYTPSRSLTAFIAWCKDTFTPFSPTGSDRSSILNAYENLAFCEGFCQHTLAQPDWDNISLINDPASWTVFALAIQSPPGRWALFETVSVRSRCSMVFWAMVTSLRLSAQDLEEEFDNYHEASHIDNDGVELLEQSLEHLASVGPRCRAILVEIAPDASFDVTVEMFEYATGVLDILEDVVCKATKFGLANLQERANQLLSLWDPSRSYDSE
ncbi:hypothetical protein JAAARDRAFT_34182 [Jaapia argillacea MUCL 33604]|uniref:Uncharacterized protein n=1 Tax=Jaapia argillacea MUCL 33604 TaxID=933084 RepID=A0A067Q4H2_9AGAM|nr:hypothetical protein JAAARDRAFT_34182 [Jaapia argillacea MUCL 33604]